MQVGVFGNEAAGDKSAWMELPRPLKRGTPIGNPVFQHSSFRTSEAGAAGGSGSGGVGCWHEQPDDEDGPTAGN